MIALDAPWFGIAAITFAAACALWRQASLLLLAAVVAGHAVFAVDFAKIGVSIGEMPLYVTEAALAVVLFGTLVGGRVRLEDAKPLVVAVSIFSCIGLVLVLAAASGSTDPLLALRQSALFYYSLCSLAVAWNLDLARDRKLILAVLGLIIGGSLAVLAGRLATGQSFETDAGADRFIRGDAASFLAMMVCVTIFARNRSAVRQMVLALTSCACLLGVVLSQHRSLWLATVIAQGLGLLIGIRRGTLARAFVLVGLLVLLAFVSDTIGITDTRTTLDRLLTSTDPTTPNAAWRLTSWALVLDDAADNPVTGVGLGHVPPSAIGEVAVSPHNSFVSIYWYSGLVGLFSFFLIQAVFLRRLTISSGALRAMGWSSVSVLACWVLVLVFSAFNVILESPTGAMLFWPVVGIPFARGAVGSRSRRSTSGHAAEPAVFRGMLS